MHPKYKEKSNTSDIEIEKIIAERQVSKNREEQRRRMVKTAIFFLFSIFYVKLFFDGWAGYFVGLPGVFWTDRHIGGFPLAFVLGILFIWLPDGFIESIQDFFVSSNNRAYSSRYSMSSVPTIALRFFGWVIYIVPALSMVLYYIFGK